MSVLLDGLTKPQRNLVPITNPGHGRIWDKSDPRTPHCPITIQNRVRARVVGPDPVTGEIKKTIHMRYPNNSGTLVTAGGLVFLALLDGTIAAYDDTTLDEIWKINVASGISTPPITFEVHGQQYIAITTGMGVAARGRIANTPELKEMTNATVLYVFGL